VKRSFRCPQCGGHFEAEHVGPLQDKWLVCQHCGHRIDVPDEYAVTHATEEKTADGSRRVEVTQRRRDLTPGSGSKPVVGSTPERSREALEQELRRLGVLGKAESLGDLSKLKPGDSISLRDVSRSHSVQSSHIAIAREVEAPEGGLAWAGPAVLQVPGQEDVVLTREELERKIKSGEIILEAGGEEPRADPVSRGDALAAAPFEIRGPVPEELAQLLAKGGLKPGATHVVTKTITETRTETPRSIRYLSTDDGNGSSPLHVEKGSQSTEGSARVRPARSVARRRMRELRPSASEVRQTLQVVKSIVQWLAILVGLVVIVGVLSTLAR